MSTQQKVDEGKLSLVGVNFQQVNGEKIVGINNTLNIEKNINALQSFRYAEVIENNQRVKEKS